ncbi:metallopeptidase TldD-related protein [Occallatibacter riparius]|uniref:Metallopeptidase TldD-related protein n=1 Tax=Occallatibacter riparius TaxID=1002689 RepID=A0A9J7BPL0_9BACT|nr:metallopeptidase TldD-related protein [Occallatibacter riparius]UWZ84699.1 metallopeptidase TldD-related protein [Occallatibacter riparius]
MKMRFVALLAGAGFLAMAMASSAQPTRADAEKDPILKAMLQELDRSKSDLQLKGFEKPFFIEYRIEEVDAFETKAEFGATEGSSHAHQRIARVTVRVGDYKTDSSGQRGDGALQLAGLGDDPIAIRSALWQATDQAYKEALDAYAQKQAELKQVQTPPQADDFSKEKPVISLEPQKLLVLFDTDWPGRVAKASGLYRTDPTVKASEHDVQYSIASFSARVTTSRLVNSEGTIVRKSSSSYQESFAVGTQAVDGMRIDRSHATTGAALSDLDSAEAFDKHAVALIASLNDLRNAPVVEEEYHGPILLSADASTDVLRALLARGVAATRPRLGTEARTNGPFASSYHTKVLPEFINVVDDPLMKVWDGRNLIGAYAVDDQGVPAQSVKLVNAGRLENYLIGREPVRDFPNSNGHARAALMSAPRPTIGVLKITAENGLSDEDLNKKLLALGKDRDLKSVYYVQTMGGATTPRLLYRVSLDGKRELVRGAQLDDLDQRALRSSIEAAGKDLWVTNYLGEIPETVLAPALLLNDGTVKRANEKHEKLPFYPAPE